MKKRIMCLLAIVLMLALTSCELLNPNNGGDTPAPQKLITEDFGKKAPEIVYPGVGQKSVDPDDKRVESEGDDPTNDSQAIPAAEETEPSGSDATAHESTVDLPKIPF